MRDADGGADGGADGAHVSSDDAANHDSVGDETMTPDDADDHDYEHDHN